MERESKGERGSESELVGETTGVTCSPLASMGLKFSLLKTHSW